jgi:NAD+ diphosphatase
MSDAFVPLVRLPEDSDVAGAVAGAGPEAGGRPAHWFVVRNGEVLLTDDGEFPLGTAIDVGVAGAGEPVLLGLLAGVPALAVGVEPGTEPRHGMEFHELRALSASLPERRWVLAGRAVQIVEWTRTHRFCGRCATPTEPSPGERAKRCPACGLLAFPRLAPAVITLVERGDEILLANGRAFGVPMYSCLAGFVEPGETLEEAVRREVAEEVGVELADVRYFASQPWPFPHSLMIGFTATWAANEIEIDPEEIVAAGWFRADAMPLIPPGLSIARWLIDDWLRRRA